MDINDGLEGVNEGVNIFNFLKIKHFSTPTLENRSLVLLFTPVTAYLLYWKLTLIYIPF